MEILSKLPKDQTQNLPEQCPLCAPLWLRVLGQDTTRHQYTFQLPNTCLRKILKVYCPKTISNTRLHQATKQRHICLILKKRRWTRLGPVYRMSNDLPTKTLLTWMPERSRKRGRPKTTWQQILEEELKAAGLTWGTATRRAQDRGVWRDLVQALCATDDK